MSWYDPEEATRRQRFHADDQVERLIRFAADGPNRPWLTTDARRYPNVNLVNRASPQGMCYAAGVTDPDLIAPIARLIQAVDTSLSTEDEWVLANMLDAAIDEQDRRRGIVPIPVTRISRRDAPPL